MWRGVRKQKSKVGSRCSACRQIQLNIKKPAGAGFSSTSVRLRANEVDVSQLRFVSVTLYSLSFNFTSLPSTTRVRTSL